MFRREKESKRGSLPPKEGDLTCMKNSKWIKYCPNSALSIINKRPKGPHIVHLSTMCHLFDGLARAAILFFRSAQKTQTW